MADDDYNKFMTLFPDYRENSYDGWTKTSPIPKNLANAGFIYSKISDTVHCLFCSKSISDWKLEEDPLKKHEEVSPNCEFILKMRLMEERNQVGTNNLAARKSFYTMYPNYRMQWERLDSFKNRPKSVKMAFTALDYARSGFFYVGPQDDTVQCYICGGVLRNLTKSQDDLLTIHTTNFPQCWLGFSKKKFNGNTFKPIFWDNLPISSKGKSVTSGASACDLSKPPLALPNNDTPLNTAFVCHDTNYGEKNNVNPPKSSVSQRKPASASATQASTCGQPVKSIKTPSTISLSRDVCPCVMCDLENGPSCNGTGRLDSNQAIKSYSKPQLVQPMVNQPLNVETVSQQGSLIPTKTRHVTVETAVSQQGSLIAPKTQTARVETVSQQGSFSGPKAQTARVETVSQQGSLSGPNVQVSVVETVSQPGSTSAFEEAMKSDIVAAAFEVGFTREQIERATSKRLNLRSTFYISSSSLIDAILDEQETRGISEPDEPQLLPTLYAETPVSSSSTVETSSVTDPKTKSYFAEVEAAMRSANVVTALEVGFSRQKIRNVLQKELEVKGVLFQDSAALMEALLDYDSAEENSNPSGTTSTNLEENTQQATRGEKRLRDHSADRGICKICLDVEIELLFLPCGHAVSCDLCGKSMTSCPVCRKKIKKRVRAYLA